MFMRAGFVIGHAGIIATLLILILSKTISALTGLSISAIATNTEVKGGGAYYLISRTMGPEFGGTIGLTLYLAQTLSVPFYILGFTEALIFTADSFAFIPPLQPYFGLIAIVTLLFLFSIAYIGAGWAIKAQYAIMAILGLAILAFIGGAALNFDITLLRNNLRAPQEIQFSFWALFAIYFPAVTGIMAGVNMSGDLKNPSRSIPMGTLFAIGAGFFIYAAQVILVGGAISRNDLINSPFHSLVSIAPLFSGFLVIGGVFCATISSAIGSLLGAPRVLQSLGQDKILKPASPFSHLGKNGEPRRALYLTFAISFLVIYLARNGGDGEAFNIVASLVTMLFLWTYGITNLAAFVESFTKNPSFRPRFKFFHWFPALIGAGASFAVSFLVDAPVAVAATFLVFSIFLYVKRFIMEASFGDARRGFVYSRTRDHLFRLSQLPVHSKNWRPTIVVLSGNPKRRLTLVKYADWLSSGRGIVTMALLQQGKLDNMLEERTATISKLDTFVKEHKIRAFPEVLITRDFDQGLNMFLQSTSIGPIKPNLALFGWSGDPSRAAGYLRSLKTAAMLDMSVVLVHDNGLPDKGRKRIDIWWRGEQNGSLMVILAYLLTLNPEWSGAQIRILRVVTEISQKSESYSEMKRLIDAARIDADIEIVFSGKKFSDLLYEYSSDATVVFLGLSLPEEQYAGQFQSSVGALLEKLPTTLFIYSTGEADLLS
ncbi:Na-K-Cl cotransporter [Chitinispirillum alkaliphilum]|nr:Na-K-Cl cotransporter [Chitinispirillum alkaliphilum]